MASLDGQALPRKRRDNTRCSRADGHEQGGTALNPVLAGCFAELEVDLHHVRIALDCALSDGVVVAWALVDVLRWLGSLRDRLEVDDRHLDVELHDLWLAEALLLVVPLCTFKEESLDVSTILRSLTKFFLCSLRRQEVELKAINGRRVLLSAEPLQKRSSETSGESKGTDPENSWLAVLSNPVSEEIVSLVEILLPVGQRLSAEVCERPQVGHLVFSALGQHLLQLWRDQLKTLDAKL